MSNRWYDERIAKDREEVIANSDNKYKTDAAKRLNDYHIDSSEELSLEQVMARLLGGNLKKAIGKDSAIANLKKAKNLLHNAGYTEASRQIGYIIIKAASEDDSDIEVL
jgi:hypothetical protein